MQEENIQSANKAFYRALGKIIKRHNQNTQSCAYLYFYRLLGKNISSRLSSRLYGGVYWSYQLTISYDAEEFSRIFKNTHTGRSTVTEREARALEGILREIAASGTSAQALAYIYIYILSVYRALGKNTSSCLPVFLPIASAR